MEDDLFSITPATVKGQALLLDTDYIFYNGIPVMRLWCKDENGWFQIAVGDFRPYCYVVPNGYETAAHLIQKLKKAATSAFRNDLEKDEQYKCVITEETKKWYGKDLNVLRVEIRNPKDLNFLRAAFSRVEGVKDVLEANIPLAKRYLVDTGTKPTSTIEYEGTAVGKNIKLEPGKKVISVGPPNLSLLKTMSFDMEVWNRDGFPTGKDPITLLTIAGSHLSETICLEATVSELHSSVVPDDYGVCAAFIEFWKDYDADVIFTYNGDNFDWPHLVARLNHHGLELPRGRDGVPVYLKPSGKDGDDIHVKMTGRANIDLYRIAKRDLLDLKQKGLDDLAAYLKIPTYDDWTKIPPEDMWQWFLDPERRPRLKKYAKTDAEVTLGAGKKLMPLQAALSRFTNIPLGEIAASYRGAQVEYYLIRKSVSINQLVPNKNEGGDDEEYEGATVLDPVAGLHEDVTGFDFSGLYPSIMDEYNISPETYVGALEDWLIANPSLTEANAAELYHILPDLPPAIDDDGKEVKVPRHMFLKSPDGFLRSIIRELRKERKDRKKDMVKLEDAGQKDSPEYDILDLEQHVIKVLTNSLYGYTGWRKSRWFFLPCAESVTGWGRWMLLQLKDAAEHGKFWEVWDEEFAKKYPTHAQAARDFMATATEEEKLLLILAVLYGDTDSVFVKGPKWLKALLGEWANRNLPVQVEWKENYLVLFFPGPKKRYCGLEEKESKRKNPVTGEEETYHKIVVKGLETKRGDWSPLARHVQETCIEKILRERDIAGAAKFTREHVMRLKAGKFDVKELTIRKGLTRTIEEYDAPIVKYVKGERVEIPRPKMAHIEAYKRATAQDPNFKLNVGDKIPYVVLKKEPRYLGRGKYDADPAMHEKSCLVQFWDGKTPLDMDYYIDKQVVPAAMRLLDFFGYDDQYFATGAKETKLF